jgi:multiple sugar transport system permease protein
MSTATQLAAPHASRTTPKPTGTKRRRPASARLRYAGTIAAFLAPSAVPLALFTLYPMGRALWTSLHEWNLLAPMKFVGLANYTDLPGKHRPSRRELGSGSWRAN